MSIKSNKLLENQFKKISEINTSKKSILDVIFDYTLNKLNKKKEQKGQKASEKKIKKRNEICLDDYGKFVKCRVQNNKTVTEDGANFSGTIKKIGKNGEKINTKYKEGYKTQKNIGENTVKLYTANSTKVIKKDIGTVSEINVNESLVNQNCQSFLYYDPDVKLARIDFENKNGAKLAEIEIRYNGTISGLRKNEGIWKPYFIKNGLDVKYDKNSISELYKQLKQIMDECKDNSLLSEKNHVQELEKQIDGIYYNVIEKI